MKINKLQSAIRDIIEKTISKVVEVTGISQKKRETEKSKIPEQKNDQKINMNQFKNYREAIEVAHPDFIGDDGFLEPNFVRMDILKYVDENKLSQIFVESNTLDEFKTNTKQALKEEEEKWEKEEQQQQDPFKKSKEGISQIKDILFTLGNWTEKGSPDREGKKSKEGIPQIKDILLTLRNWTKKGYSDREREMMAMAFKMYEKLDEAEFVKQIHGEDRAYDYIRECMPEVRQTLWKIATYSESKGTKGEKEMMKAAEEAVNIYDNAFENNIRELSQAELDYQQDIQMVQFKNYREAIYAAYPDLIGDSGFLEANHERIMILRNVENDKLNKIFSESTTLAEFKTHTMQALDEEEKEQYMADEIYAKYTVDGDICNIKEEYFTEYLPNLKKSEAPENVLSYDNKNHGTSEKLIQGRGFENMTSKNNDFDDDFDLDDDWDLEP